MTIEVQGIQRIQVTEEASNAFAENVTATATFLDVPVIEGSAEVKLMRPVLDANIITQRHDRVHEPYVISAFNRAEFTFSMPLYRDNETAAISEDESAQAIILKTVFGGFTDGGVNRSVDSTANDYTITLNAGTTVSEGGAITNGIETRAVQDKTSQTLKVYGAFSETPSGTVYTHSTIYPTEDPDTTLQFIVQGAEAHDYWLLSGCQLTAPPSIDLTIGEIPRWTFTFTAANWQYLGTDTIADATYNDFELLAFQGDVFYVEQDGSPWVANKLDVSSIAYSFNSPVYQEVKTTELIYNGTSYTSAGMVRWRRSRAVPFCEIEFSIPYEDQTWFTFRDNETKIGFYCQFSQGHPVLFDAPKCIVYDVQRVDADGLAYQTIKLRTQVDDTTSASGEQAEAAFRIHLP